MKVVVLAGGIGTRLTEETEIKPKPMGDWRVADTVAYYEALCPLRASVPGVNDSR